MIHLNKSATIQGNYLNRHTMITGQTGTGKTVSILKMTEAMAQAGIPVFLSDVKGDLSALAGTCEVQSLDMLDGSAQIPVWSIGADFLARSMELSDTQSATLEVAFTYAERKGLPFDSLDDLRACLVDMVAHRDGISATLGQVSASSIGVIQRGILRLENAGARPMFGPNRLDIKTMMEPGVVTILNATKLYQSPRVYSMFLLWLMREFWQRLPETGDLPLPMVSLVFDEAHTIFSDISPPLLRQTEQTARLIRSKGVALIWASQSASDIPPIIAEQCATRLEHSRDLGVGFARFTTLDQFGKPTPPVITRPALPDCGLDLHTLPRMAPPPAPDTLPPDASAPLIVMITVGIIISIIGAIAWHAINWHVVIGIGLALAFLSWRNAAT